MTLATFKVILAILSENKCMPTFWYLIESPGDLMMDDNADDLENLNVWSHCIVSLHVYQNHK